MDDILKMLHARRGHLIEEMERVDAAIKALGGELVTPNDVRKTLGVPERVNYRGMSVKKSKPRRNRRRGGTREEHVLKALKKGPMAINEINKAIGIKSTSTYLYRVIPRMEREGKLKKVDKKYALV